MYFAGKENMVISTIFEEVSNSFAYEFYVKPTASIQLVQESYTGVTGIKGQRYVIGPGHGEIKTKAGIGISVGTNGIAVFEHTADHLPALLVYPIPINDWTHITVVFRDKIPILYINGQFRRRGLRSLKQNVYASGIFGGYDPYGFYIGFIRDITIWSSPKLPQQIREDEKQIVSENGMFGYWKFDNGTLPNATGSLITRTIEKKLFSDISVLFVKSGYDSPYSPLERSIIAALKRNVQELHVALPKDDLLSIAQRTKPDLVLVFCGFQLACDKVDALKKYGFKTVIWMTDDPYYTDITKVITPYYDFVFTQEINCVSFYTSLGCKNVYHLPLAVDLNIYYPKNVDKNYNTDILFIGNAFWNRVEFFDSIADYLVSKNIMISGLWWDRLKNYQLLRHKIYLNRWLSPEETANYYNGAKIVINLHRSSGDANFNRGNEGARHSVIDPNKLQLAPDGINQNSGKIKALSLNPRTFEISACGAFQLTDERSDLSDFYTPGYDVVTYDTSADFVRKVEYYLTHEEERKLMEGRALDRIRNEHTFYHRISKLITIVLSEECT